MLSIVDSQDDQHSIGHAMTEIIIMEFIARTQESFQARRAILIDQQLRWLGRKLFKAVQIADAAAVQFVLLLSQSGQVISECVRA